VVLIQVEVVLDLVLPDNLAIIQPKGSTGSGTISYSGSYSSRGSTGSSIINTFRR